ncbi:MAG: phage tail terminator-like protein [Acinetobacter sp.]
MGYVSEREIIVSKFISGWTNTAIVETPGGPVEEKKLETVIELDNRPIDSKSLAEFVRFSVLSADSSQVAIGCDIGTRYYGLVSLTIFVRPSTGEARTLELVDRFSSIFRQRREKNIVFRTPDVDRQGVVEEWYQVNVSIPFFRTD